MYRTLELPEHWKAASRAWAELHPDYEYMLWTDADLRELIAEDYPWLLSTYDAYPHATQRWDASRYAILHKYGGVYSDLDVAPLARVDPLLDGQRLLLPRTPNIGLTNALMASVPAHPFMAEALRLLPEYAHAWFHISKHNTVLASTGSTYVWALFMRWPRYRAEQPALVQASTWGKCSVCESPTTLRDPELPGGRPLFQHSAGSSWHATDSAVTLFLFCRLEIVAAVALGAAVFVRARSCAVACTVGVAALAACWLASALDIRFFEAFLARPWIWLIMT